MMTASAKRLQVYRDEFLEASKKHNELFELFLLEYRKRFKLGREVKALKQELREKEILLKREMRNYKRLEFRSKQTEKAQLENFADMSKSLALLENFTYNYAKLFPKNRGASRSDVMMFKSAKRSIAVLRGRKDDLSHKYFDDSLVATCLVGGSQSLFKLSEKLEILDKNLQILASSGLGADEASVFEKRLKSNQEFIFARTGLAMSSERF